MQWTRRAGDLNARPVQLVFSPSVVRAASTEEYHVSISEASGARKALHMRARSMLVPVARDQRHPMRALARREIALAMWRWTADAFDTRENLVRQDAFKYNVKVHPATRAAREVAELGSAGLRHEHAVPRQFLADRIIELDPDPQGILGLLEKWCKAVVVTEEEERRVLPKSGMPDGWSWETGSPYAPRYEHSGVEILWPDRGTASPRSARPRPFVGAPSQFPRAIGKPRGPRRVAQLTTDHQGYRAGTARRRASSAERDPAMVKAKPEVVLQEQGHQRPLRKRCKWWMGYSWD